MQIENHTIPVPYNSRLNQTAKSTMAGHKDGTKQVLSYRKNMRTAGTIAVWTPTSTPPFTLPEKALNEAITAKKWALIPLYRKKSCLMPAHRKI